MKQIEVTVTNPSLIEVIQSLPVFNSVEEANEYYRNLKNEKT